MADVARARTGEQGGEEALEAWGEQVLTRRAEDAHG